MEDNIVTLATLPEKWRSWLGEWAEDFDPNLPVVHYETDGEDVFPEVFEDGPHLAIREDAFETVPGTGEALGPDKALVWPVDVEGWADIRKLGWRGVLPLLKAGKRLEDADG
jgi:hypothetical protein